MAIHACETCGLVHDHVTPMTNPDVEIARIQADAQIRMAQLQSRADRHAVEVEAEASVDVAEAQAEAVTALLAVEDQAQAEAVEEAPVEPAPAPVVVSTPIIDSGNDEVPEPPKRDETERHEEPAPKKRGLGFF